MAPRRSSVPLDIGAEEALDLATAQSENVFLFYPNLIGYTRILLAGLSLHFMSYHPIYCTIAYCVSCLLDAVDGQVARALGQTSKFGAVLDMVTDRCTTSCLLCYLSSAYPYYALWFQFLIALDFSSHYMHMYSSLVTGQRSHKLVRGEVSWILWAYYNNPYILFFFCAGNELFFVSLYLMKWTGRIMSMDLMPWVSPWTPPMFAPATVDLPWVSPALAYAQSRALALTYAQFFALLSFPVFALKNFVNIVQLWKASKILVGVDIKERQEARKESLKKKQT